MKNTPLASPESGYIDIANLEKQAISKLETGQYKEATDLFKRLLKCSNNDSWRQGLARCYLQRALTFAEKAMFKEALVLWENYAQNADTPHEARGQYIRWLLQVNDMAKANICLGQLTAQQLDKDYPELSSLLGLLIITEKLSCLEMLPKDSAFMMHLGIVQEALKAFRHRNRHEIEQALNKLPFRSAFRDFRTLLKAALLIPESIEKTHALLAKIPADSPYHSAGQMLLALTDDGAALINDLLLLSSPQIMMIEEARNLDKQQIDLLSFIYKQKGRLTDKGKFNLAIHHQPLFGADLARHYCLAALSDYPAGQLDYTRHFGATNNFDVWRLKALFSERNGDFNGAEFYWKHGIAALQTQGAGSAFKIALIMRHIAAHQDSPGEAIPWLEESLEHDPDDRETYVKILHYYEGQEQQNDVHKEWLDKCLKMFPSDIVFLTLTIKAATRNKAYKKATQYAKTLLIVDPVNTFAKQVLFTSHLAHAGKLIKTKKFHLAEKEIQQAERITIGKHYQTQARLMRGFFMFVADDKNQGTKLIAESAQKLHDSLACAHFYTAVEALLLDLQLEPIFIELPPLTTDYLMSEQEVTQLVKLIQDKAKAENVSQSLIHRALEIIVPVISQSLKQQHYREETLLSLCQSLAHIQQYEMLRACVKSAQSQRDKPIWMYYRVFSEVNGVAGKCSFMNFLRLQESLENAHLEKDHRAIALIGKFLDQYQNSRTPSGFNILDSLYGSVDNIDDDPITILFGHLPDDIYDQLEEKTTQLTKKMTPERILKILAADYLSNDVPKMLNLLKSNPDSIYAFVMLKAADDFGFDIGVTAEAIVECFTNHKVKSKPQPFSFF